MTLHLYILRQLAVALALAVGGTTFVIFPAIAVSAVQKLGGVNAFAMLGYLPLVAMELVPYLLPMGFLLSLVAVYGRMAAENEWTAIRMARWNPLGMLFSALILALLLGAGTHHLLATVRPEWKFRQTIYRRQMLSEAVKSLDPGRTSLSIGEFYLSAGSRPGPDRFGEVLVYLPLGDEGDVKLVADLATVRSEPDELVLAFEGARIVQGPNDVFWERPEIRIPWDRIVEPVDTTKGRGKYMTSGELRAAISRDTAGTEPLEPERRRDFEYQIQNRRALAASFLLFVLIGPPVGVRLRRGNQLAALTVGVGIAFVYYIASMRLGRQLVHIGGVPPLLAVWSTNLIAGLLGGWATWRVLRR